MLVTSSLRRFAAAGVAAAVVLASFPALAKDEPTTLGDVSLGFASGVCTLLYTPLKLVYAVSGAGIAGLVYLFSAGDSDSAGLVLRSAAGGDYVVEPGHLRGVRVFRITGD